MELPDITSFDKDAPESFYLGSSEGEFAGLADATLVVGGRKLRVHTQVLAQHSSVLRSAIAAHLEKSKAEKLNLRSCFEGFSIRVAAAFLRFVYWPEEATPASFSGLGLSSAWLNGVARLAHFLDAAALLHKLEAFFASEVTTADIQVLVSWSELAEQCNLHRLRLCCARQLAIALASSPRRSRDFSFGGSSSGVHISASSKEDVVSAVADAAPLKDLSSEVLQAVIASLAVAIRSHRSGYGSGLSLPSEEQLQELLLPDGS